MLKIDFTQFLRDRIWFGWCYDARFTLGWFRGTNTDNYWKIRLAPRYD